jgi:hypothetical protein
MTDTPTPFQALRYDGERFAKHTLPVDVLPDLLAYRDLIVEVAKELFRLEHGRARVPKGFDEHLRLDLANIGEGSAIAQLENVSEVVDDESGNAPLYFSKARDLINDSISAASENRPLPSEFPTHLLSYFNRFGRTLQPDESIEMRVGRATRAVRYSGAVRKNLVLRTARRVEVAIDLVGIVTECNGTDYTFMLQQNSGAPIRAPYQEAMERVLIQAFEHRAEQWQVRVSGIGIYNHLDQLLKITDTTHVELAESPELLEMRSRLAGMAELAPGWFESDSAVPTTGLILKATSLLVAIVEEHDLPVPHIYPIPDGGIQAEWDTATHSVELRFSADEQTVVVIGDPKAAGDSDEESVPLSAEGTPSRLAALLSRYFTSRVV